jgi:serine/threonine-protein kinase HipA
MRQAEIFVNNILAGYLYESADKKYQFNYLPEYQGPPISLILPVSQKTYEFSQFPAFFDGLLPEGVQLEGLLKKYKIDRNDMFTQLVTIGEDTVGAITVREIK